MSSLYPKVDLEDFCKLYGLEVRENICTKCGEKQKTTIPFVSKNWRGLVSPLCKCGPEYQLRTAFSAKKEQRKRWKEIFRRLVDVSN